MNKLKVLLASMALVIAPAIMFAPSAHAATRLGGVDMNAACWNQWPGSTLALIQNNVMGWKCKFWSSLGPVYFDIDVSKQCKVQYNNTYAYAAYSDYNNPYSWSCYR